MDSVEPKEQGPGVYGGRMKIRGRMGFWENLRIGHWVVGGSEVNCELLFRSTRLKRSDLIWMDSVEPKEQRPHVQDGRMKKGGRMGFSENLGIGHWVVGGSEVNYQLLSRSLRL